MDKLGNYVSTVKDSRVWQESSGASDKMIKCLAVIGLFSTARALWPPFKNYVFGKNAEGEDVDEGQQTEEENKENEEA
jgi:hypothetical protein